MVTDLLRNGDRITHVVSEQGRIEAGIVVNAAGLWARQLGWMAGAEIPAGVVEHQYLVTEKSDRIPLDLPALRDPDGGFYAKPEPGALAIGGWEKQTRAVNPREGFPWQNERFLFDGELERLQEFFEPALKRLPILGELGMRSIVNGPIPISPDGEPIMGPVPGLSNFFAACAFTSGIAASGAHSGYSMAIPASTCGLSISVVSVNCMRAIAFCTIAQSKATASIMRFTGPARNWSRRAACAAARCTRP
jgi:4-methylaminobutanoate oxidase (formaldehyde-forming)